MFTTQRKARALTLLEELKLIIGALPTSFLEEGILNHQAIDQELERIFRFEPTWEELEGEILSLEEATILNELKEGD